MPANTSDFLGEGVNAGPGRAADPDDEPNPANPGGLSNNAIRRLRADDTRAAAAPRLGGARQGGTAVAPGAAATGVPLATAGYYAGNQATRDSYNQSYRTNNPVSRVDLNPFNAPTAAQLGNGKDARAVTGAAPTAGMRADGQPYVGSSTDATAPNNGTTGVPGQSSPAGGGRPNIPASPGDAGISPPPGVGQDPGTTVRNSAGPAPAPMSVNRAPYDAQAARLQELQGTFLQQLERLSGSDPFGNQAAMQKATDRAVSQAAGTAVGARGGAAALAGAQRQAVGVQAQTAARGTQDIVEQRRRDQQQATGLGLQAIGGAADIGKQLTENEIALADQITKAGEVNLRAYLGGRELDANERESLRRLAVEGAKINMQRYQTDVGYRESVNANLASMYAADAGLQATKMKVDADENLSESEWMMGLMGMGAGIAGGMASDERAKTARVRPSTKTLREFVEAGDGEFYEYTEPHKPGRRPGKNFGPMAQHLARTEIGRTLVSPDRDGTLRVDTARLALADHSAVTHLAKRLARLEKRASRGKGPNRGR